MALVRELSGRLLLLLLLLLLGELVGAWGRRLRVDAERVGDDGALLASECLLGYRCRGGGDGAVGDRMEDTAETKVSSDDVVRAVDRRSGASI
jgi:hypothetical protein